MILRIQTTIDQDVGIEALHAESGSQKPIDKFAEQLFEEFLNRIQPRLQERVRTRVQRLLEDATDEKIAEIEALLP